MEVHWYITAPDGRYPWKPEGARKVDHAYFQQVARAVDHLGFSGALLATGPHDVWVLGASLIPTTERMKFLLAVHPGLVSPVLLAKMATTFDSFSRGRLLFNVVSGGEYLRGFGLPHSHDELYELSDEYLTVFRRVIQGESFDFHGRYVQVTGAIPPQVPPVQLPYPPLWFGGSSDPALSVAATHVDKYLTWGEPPQQAGEKIDRVRQLAAARGRELTYGIRLYVIVRETEEEAWEAAGKLLRKADPAHATRLRSALLAQGSVGATRMASLYDGGIPDDPRALEISPNLWTGIGLFRGGPGTAIVGSPESVARVLYEYQDQGFDTFILSGIPLLEEAYRVAELLLPLLPLDQPDDPAALAPSWSGELKRVAAGGRS